MVPREKLERIPKETSGRGPLRATGDPSKIEWTGQFLGPPREGSQRGLGGDRLPPRLAEGRCVPADSPLQIEVLRPRRCLV